MSKNTESSPKKRAYTNGFCKYGKVWWVCFKYKGKKVERSTKKKTIEEAVAFLADLKQQLGIDSQEEIEVTIKPKDDHSLLAAAKLWLSKIVDVSERYKEQMMEVVEIHMKDWNHFEVNEITNAIISDAVHKYMTTKGKKTLKGVQYEVNHSIGGVNTMISRLSALFSWIIDELEWIEVMPWRRKMKKIQKTEKPVVFSEMVQEFIPAVDRSTKQNIIKLSIKMQLGLGLRETETSTADWRWFIQRNKTYHPGLTKNLKTRSISVPNWLFKELHAEWVRQGKPTHGLILKYKDGSKPIYRGFTKNATASAGIKIGLFGLHPHRLRASFATSHAESGTKIRDLMAMMGHSNEATTNRYIVKRNRDSSEAQNRVASTMGFDCANSTNEE